MAGKNVINILMADDDEDDRYFFAKALKSLSIPTKLVTVSDGEQLIEYLEEHKDNTPDLLFLDINMPRKNGYECLVEIKGNTGLKDFPVIMYSTSLRDVMADSLFENGAHYYLTKCDLDKLKEQLQLILTLFRENNFQKPSRKEFVLIEAR